MLYITLKGCVMKILIHRDIDAALEDGKANEFQALASIHSLLFYTIRVITQLAFGIHLLHKAMNIGFKTRALGIELAGKL